MKALLVAPNQTFELADVPLPEPGPNEIRIKVHAVALNPVDSLYRDYVGRTVGSDVAGVVEKVGSAVLPRELTIWGSWNVGDRVAALLQGATTETPRPGAFAEYAILEADLAFLIPENLSFEEAATIPLSALTTAQSLYIKLGLPAPFPVSSQLVSPKSLQDPSPLLLYSGATTLGLFTFSFLQAHNPTSIKIYATASAKHHSRLLSLGAAQVHDYRDPEWPAKIKKASGDTIHLGYDTISEGDTTALTSSAFGEEGGTLSVIRGASWSKEGVKKNVKPIYSAAWSGLGHEIKYNGSILPANPLWREFTVEFYKWLSGKSQPLETIPYRLMPGGLERIHLDGLNLLANGRVDHPPEHTEVAEEWLRPISGEKLVYRVL